MKNLKSAIVPVVTVPLVTPLTEVISLLNNQNITTEKTDCILVVDNQKLVGIFTVKDLARLIIKKFPIESLNISEVMTNPVISLIFSSSHNINSALNIFRAYNINHLPIIDLQEKILGIVTIESIFEQNINPYKTTEKQLKKLNIKLEKTIRERTEELEKIKQSRQYIEMYFVESQQELQYFLEHTSDIIQIVDLHSDKLLYVNPRGQEIFGYGENEINLLTMADLLHPLSKIKYRELITQFKEKKINKIERIELIAENRTGQIIILEGSIKCRFKNNQIMLLNIILKNITESKQAEQEIIASQERLNTVINHSAEGIMVVDLNGKILFINPTACKLFACDIQDLINTPWGIPLLADNYQEIQLWRRDNTLITVDMRVTNINWSGNIAYLVSMRDITERKQIEQKLQEQLAAIEATIDGIALIKNEKYIFLNPAYLQMFGYENAEELLGKSWTESYLAEDVELFRKNIFPIVISQKYWQGEVRGKREDGSIFNEELSLTLIEDGTLICVCRDITKRKEYEVELCLSNALLHTISTAQSQFISDIEPMVLFNGLISNLLALTNSEYGFIAEIEYQENGEHYLSQSYIKNRSNHQFHTMNISEINQEKKEPAGGDKQINNFKDLVKMIIFTKKVLIINQKNIEFNIKELADIYSPINSFLGIPFYNNRNQMVGLVGILNRPGGYNQNFVEYLLPFITTCANIIEAYRNEKRRQQVEIELRKNKEFLAQVIDLNPNCIFVKDKQGRYILANQSLANLFETSLENIIGKTDIELLPNHSQFSGFFPPSQSIIESEKIVHISQGKIKIFRIIKTPIISGDEEEDKILVIATDITELKKAEQDILKTLKREKELNELKSRFISMTSHEFRTPLTVISSSAGILKTFGHKLSPEKQKEHLQIIQNYVKHTTELLDDILLLNKADGGKIYANFENIQLLEFCQNLSNEIQISAINNQIIFSCQCIDYACIHQGTSTKIDKKLLRQILINLLSNALKYSPESLDINFNLIFAEKTVIFEIQDHGIGIPETDLEHLFESFHRASNVGTIQGTGLGLSIVKKCVDLCQGTVTVESQLNEGTKVTVILPRF